MGKSVIFCDFNYVTRSTSNQLCRERRRAHLGAPGIHPQQPGASFIFCEVFYSAHQGAPYDVILCGLRVNLKLNPFPHREFLSSRDRYGVIRHKMPSYFLRLNFAGKAIGILI